MPYIGEAAWQCSPRTWFTTFVFKINANLLSIIAPSHEIYLDVRHGAEQKPCRGIFNFCLFDRNLRPHEAFLNAEMGLT